MAKRKVFGRQQPKVNDVPLIFEMHSDGVHVRRKRRRTQFYLSWSRLWDLATGQFELDLYNAQQRKVGKASTARAKSKRPRKKPATAPVLVAPGEAVSGSAGKVSL